MNKIPDPSESWMQAEKMLDRHFRRRRIIGWMLFLLIPAAVGIASYMYFGKPESSHTYGSGTKNVSAGSVLNESSSSDKVSSTVAPYNNSTAAQNQKVTGHSNTQLVQSENSTIPAEKNKFAIRSKQKINQQTNSNPVVASNVDASVNNTYGRTKNSRARNSAALAAASAVNNSYETGNLNPAASSLHANNFPEQRAEHNDLFALNHTVSELPLMQSDMQLRNFNKPAADYHSSKVSFLVTVYGGANYISKNIEAKGDAGSYARQRKEEEKNIISPAFGISFTATKNKFSLSIGAEYAEYSEKTSYSPYSLQQTITDHGSWSIDTINYLRVDTAYIIGNQYFLANPQTRFDSTYSQMNDTTEEYKYDAFMAAHNGVNRISYIEVPVMVTYNLMSGRTGVGISAGFSPAFYSSTSGYYLRTDGRGIQTLQETGGFNKLIMNGRAGLDLYYRMNGRTCLSLKPQFKANLTTIFENDAVKQKYYSTGVLFGISWLLN